MEEGTAYRRLIDVTAATLKERGIELSSIAMDVPLSEEGLGLDSISRLTLLGKLEAEFGIDFPEEYWGTKTFLSLGAILSFLEKPNG